MQKPKERGEEERSWKEGRGQDEEETKLPPPDSAKC